MFTPSAPAQSAASPSPTLREWRAALLTRAGFDQAQAAKLAHCGDLDFHALLTLVDRGCPPGLAVRILAPWHPEL